MKIRNRLLAFLVLSASISLAATAAYYSVFGISKLFASQALAVIIMASILEISKLITAAYLEKYWKVIHWTRKAYLMLAMAVLMAITSLGIYGFLVSAYQDTAYKVQSVDKRVQLEQAKKQRFADQLSFIVTEKQSIETNMAQLTKGISNNILTRTDRNGNVITTTSESTRRALEKQLDQSTSRRDTLARQESSLNDSITAIDLRILQLQSNTDLASEIGPLKHVAELTGKQTSTVVNWFILLFIIVFDPLAIILLISANKALRDTEEDFSDWDVTNTDGEQELQQQPDAEEAPLAQKPSGAVGSKWWS